MGPTDRSAREQLTLVSSTSIFNSKSGKSGHAGIENSDVDVRSITQQAICPLDLEDYYSSSNISKAGRVFYPVKLGFVGIPGVTPYTPAP